jgi:hypothetical protein
MNAEHETGRYSRISAPDTPQFLGLTSQNGQDSIATLVETTPGAPQL